MTFLLAQAAPAADPISPYITALTSLGGFGLMLVLFIFGRIYLKSTYDEMRGDRDSYREAWKTEREGRLQLEATVKSIVDQNEITNGLLTAIKESLPRGRRQAQ